MRDKLENQELQLAELKEDSQDLKRIKNYIGKDKVNSNGSKRIRSIYGKEKRIRKKPSGREMSI